MPNLQPSRLIFLMLIIVSLSLIACEKKITTEMDKVSYSIGVDIGRNLQKIEELEIEMNPDILSRGIKDILTDNPIRLTDDEMNEAMQNFQKKMMAKREEATAKQMAQDPEFQKIMTENQTAASAFLAENALKSGVTTLTDSLQYDVIKEGTGPKPTATDVVRVHYHGTLLDGTVFDSSVDRDKPAEFSVSGVLPGWTEVLQLMSVGSKWKVYIPPELAYGMPGSGKIPPNSLLTFEIELLDIIK